MKRRFIVLCLLLLGAYPPVDAAYQDEGYYSFDPRTRRDHPDSEFHELRHAVREIGRLWEAFEDPNKAHRRESRRRDRREFKRWEKRVRWREGNDRWLEDLIAAALFDIEDLREKKEDLRIRYEDEKARDRNLHDEYRRLDRDEKKLLKHYEEYQERHRDDPHERRRKMRQINASLLDVIRLKIKVLEERIQIKHDEIGLVQTEFDLHEAEVREQQIRFYPDPLPYRMRERFSDEGRRNLDHQFRLYEQLLRELEALARQVKDYKHFLLEQENVDQNEVNEVQNFERSLEMEIRETRGHLRDLEDYEDYLVPERLPTY